MPVNKVKKKGGLTPGKAYYYMYRTWTVHEEHVLLTPMGVMAKVLYKALKNSV